LIAARFVRASASQHGGAMAEIGPLYVINLERTPQRWQAFESANQGGPPYTRFNAVDGRQIDAAELVSKGIMSEALRYTPGAIGCALSHIALWRACAAADGPITIGEDDAILHPDFQRAAAAAADLQPDFDLILWGWNFNSVLAGELFDGAPFAMGFDENLMRRSTAAFRSKPAAPTLLRLHRAFGCACYTLAPKGAAKLLALCLPLAPLRIFFPLLSRESDNTGIDIPMNAVYPQIAAYAAFPPLALTLNELAISTVE
jgi:GR25 family glycosyltransferase involved in LPS biosynthesis